MRRYYIAVSYDVCEHNNLYENMNEYPIDASIDLEEQVRDFAKKDVAPIIKVYESQTSDFKEFRLYREYKFKEYECRCNS
ncbi:hypothetical protein D8M04_03375 [Oceanobacillus piezotolerans]|uniref:Uncharacterized protein n=1 Tax=Oceanobacillus piezotolerans TaxID=2448030 RepID=A0A498DBD6_9BACI|nr:hypothetical protein [Oceanobacillus piezotolerans]RLL48321.1 hypothetical protein D8M04_03375 [Oceanobacillus piezotolerans]